MRIYSIETFLRKMKALSSCGLFFIQYNPKIHVFSKRKMPLCLPYLLGSQSGVLLAVSAEEADVSEIVFPC